MYKFDESLVNTAHHVSEVTEVEVTLSYHPDMYFPFRAQTASGVTLIALTERELEDSLMSYETGFMSAMQYVYNRLWGKD